MKKVFLPALLYLLPLVTLAAGLIPCGDTVEDRCDKSFCNVLKLVDNVSDWLVGIAGILLVILIIVGGLKMVLSMGNASAKQDARRFISTAVIGYLILLMAWFVVDTFLKFYTVDPEWGVWNPLVCPLVG